MECLDEAFWGIRFAFDKLGLYCDLPNAVGRPTARAVRHFGPLPIGLNWAPVHCNFEQAVNEVCLKARNTAFPLGLWCYVTLHDKKIKKS